MIIISLDETPNRIAGRFERPWVVAEARIHFSFIKGGAMTYTNLSFISARIVALHARVGARGNILIYSVLVFPSVALAGNEKLPSFFKRKLSNFS